jgi:hypothetical protein
MFFEPMFRNTVNVGAIPAQVILLGFAIVAMVVGWLWIRRALDIEPDVHSFRATAPVSPNWLLRAGIGLGFVSIALVLFALPR